MICEHAGRSRRNNFSFLLSLSISARAGPPRLGQVPTVVRILHRIPCQRNEMTLRHFSATIIYKVWLPQQCSAICILARSCFGLVNILCLWVFVNKVVHLNQCWRQPSRTAMIEI